MSNIIHKHVNLWERARNFAKERRYTIFGKNIGLHGYSLLAERLYLAHNLARGVHVTFVINHYVVARLTKRHCRCSPYAFGGRRYYRYLAHCYARSSVYLPGFAGPRVSNTYQLVTVIL